MAITDASTVPSGRATSSAMRTGSLDLDVTPAARDRRSDGRRRRRRRRRGARRRRSARWGDLRGEDLLDSLRDVALPTASAGGRPEATAPACPEVLLEGGTGDVGDRYAASLSLMAKSGIKIVGQLDGSSPHGMPASKGRVGGGVIEKSVSRDRGQRGPVTSPLYGSADIEQGRGTKHQPRSAPRS